MGNVRVYINIDKQMKEQLEELAKANFRPLNGEIQMALKLYINGMLCNAPIMATQPIKECEPNNSTPKTENALHGNLSDYDTDFEVDEF